MSEYQKCPVCDGTGLVSRPPGVAADQEGFSTSTCGPWPCRPCSGQGILVQYLSDTEQDAESCMEAVAKAAGLEEWTTNEDVTRHVRTQAAEIAEWKKLWGEHYGRQHDITPERVALHMGEEFKPEHKTREQVADLEAENEKLHRDYNAAEQHTGRVTAELEAEAAKWRDTALRYAEAHGKVARPLMEARAEVEKLTAKLEEAGDELKMQDGTIGELRDALKTWSGTATTRAEANESRLRIAALQQVLLNIVRQAQEILDA